MLCMLMIDRIGVKLLFEDFGLVFEPANLVFHLGHFSLVLFVHSLLVVKLVGHYL